MYVVVRTLAQLALRVRRLQLRHLVRRLQLVISLPLIAALAELHALLCSIPQRLRPLLCRNDLQHSLANRRAHHVGWVEGEGPTSRSTGRRRRGQRLGRARL